MESLLRQLQDPLVAAAVAFVAGGIFTALVDVLAREFSAWNAERRQRRRSQLEQRLRIVRRTHEYVWAMHAYATDRAFGRVSSYRANDWVDARIRYVGDAELVRQFYDAFLDCLGVDAGSGLSVTQRVNLAGVRDRIALALEAQEERLIAGSDPILVPIGAVDESDLNRSIIEL